MKPPFTSSGGSTPTSSSSPAAPPGGGGGGAPGGGGLPGGVPSSLSKGLPDALPDALPDDLTDLLPDELSDLPSCLPGTCDALWDAVDKGMAPVAGAVDAVSKKAAEVKDQAAKTVDEAKAKAAETIDDAKEAVRENVEMAKKYAELYQNDAKQAWAGLNSVVTQQAGCALKDIANAVDTVAPGATQAASDAAAGKIGQYVDEAGRYVDKGVGKVNEAGQAVADKARAAEKAATDFAQSGVDKMADTRKKVFDAVYPVQKFYQDNGLDKLTECGSVPGRPEVPAALTDALQQIDDGTAEGIRAGSDMIEQYAQDLIVENAIYEAERYRDEGLNELASMTDALKSGIADAIPLSSACGGPPLPFDGSLLDPAARERYYHKLMDEFEKMGKDAKDKMIDDIAKQVTP